MSGKWILSLLVLITLSVQAMAMEQVFVQQRIPVKEPLVLYGDITMKLNGLKTTFDSHNGRIYVNDSLRIYSFDIQLGSWDLYYVLDPSLRPLNMEFSPYHKGLLFWDVGVGRVFLLDSTKTITRLDKSFNHRNQHGHAGWVDPATGDISAFGGYGLYTTKSLLTRFSPLKQEWNETLRSDFTKWPSPQISTSAFPDFQNDVVYILGLKMTHADYFTRGFSDADKTKKAFWAYQISSNTWTRLADFHDEINVRNPIYKDLNLTNYSVHPDLSFLLFTVDNSLAIPRHRGLYLFDIAGNRIKRITTIESEFDDSALYMKINWSSQDQVFYALTFEFNFDLRRVIFHPVTLKITDEEAFLERLRYNEEESNPVLAIIMAMLLVSVPVGGWLVYKYRASSNTKKAHQSTLNNIFKVELGAESGITVSLNGTMIEGPGQAEWDLLELLARNSAVPNGYTISDEIENVILPSHPSQDYARRFRNLTMDRLTSYLVDVTNDPHREFILKRPTLLDKRKFEYRLNEIYFNIESRGDLSS
jgi:hypothetical protein